MKRLLVFSLLILFIFSLNSVCAAESELETPNNLLPAKILAEFINSTYDYFRDNFNSVEIELNVNEAKIEKSAFNLLALFLMINLFTLFDRLDGISPIAIFKVLLLYAGAYFLVDNVDFVWELAEYVNNLLIESSMQKDEFVNFNLVLRDYYESFPENGTISNGEQIQLTVFYTMNMLLTFFAVLLMSGILLIRLINLEFLEVLGTLALSTFACFRTFSIGTKYVQNYIFIYIQVTLITIISEMLRRFMSNFAGKGIMIQAIILLIIVLLLYKGAVKVELKMKKVGNSLNKAIIKVKDLGRNFYRKVRS